MTPDPIQLFEKVVNEDRTFTRYFSTYFRNLSQYILELFTIKSSGNLKYVVNGSIVFVKYDSETGGTITLPYKSLLNQKLKYYYYENGFWLVDFIDVLKDQQQIILPSKNIIVDSSIFVNRV